MIRPPSSKVKNNLVKVYLLNLYAWMDSFLLVIIGIYSYCKEDSMASVSQLRAQKKYDMANTRSIILKLNENTDADILDRLDEVGNRQGYIKALVRKDIVGTCSVIPLGSLRLITKAFCRRYHLDKAFLFGSYARGEATAESDIDIMVEGSFSDMTQYLNAVKYLHDVTGKEIDIVMADAVRKDMSRSGRRFLKHVEDEKVVLYG